MFDNKFNDEGKFVSLSADYRILNLRKSSLDYYVGIAGSIDSDGIGAVMGAKYLYKVTNNVGISAGLKFLNVTTNAYPIISLGVQVK